MLDARKTFRPDDPMRALGIRQQPVALDHAQREEVAARLMAGEPPEAILAALVKTGAPLAAVRAELAEAEGQPWLKAAERLRAQLAKRDWVLETRARLERLQPAEVPRRDALPADIFVREHYTTLTPVVLTGLTDHWPGRQWSLERLARLGNPEIEVQWGRESDPDFELNSLRHKRQMRWHDVLALMAEDRETNDFCVTANNGGQNRKALARLWADVGDLPGYLGPSLLGDGFFWMGPKGTVTPWHHDLTQNLLVNMVGTKRVALVSPSETHRMRNHRHCFSRFGADATLFAVPEADRPRILTVDIGPGDILFIPVGWWHHVTGLTPTIGMSFTNFVWGNDFASFYTCEGDLEAFAPAP
jgi:hypothetical protein